MIRSKKRNAVKIPAALRGAFSFVEEVVDATEPIEVIVTEKDCSKDARSLDPSECAMARAVKRQFAAKGAIIGLSKSYVVMGKRAIRFSTPQSVAREITTFDRHHDFSPGEYRLSPVSPSSQFGSVRSRKSMKGGSGSSGKSPADNARLIVRHRSVRVRNLPTGSGK